MKLYEITENYRQLEKYMDDLSGDDIFDAVDMLNEINDNATDKIKAIGKVIKNYETRAETIKKEIDRLTKMKKTATNKIDSLKDYIVFNMENMKIKKIEDDVLPVSLRKSESVDLYDIVDDEFMTPQPPKPNKKAIKEAIKSGKEVKGACICIKNNVKIG